MKRTMNILSWLLLLPFLFDGFCSAQTTVKPEDFENPAVIFYKNPSGYFSFYMSRVEGSGSDTIWVEFLKEEGLMPCIIGDTSFVQVYDRNDTAYQFIYDTVRVFVREPDKIGRIKCEGCGLTRVDFVGLPSLYWLNLMHNQLKELDVTGLPNLNFLQLAGNMSLAEIDVTKNPKLQHLNVESCDLSELDVTKNKALLHLNFGSTKISEINLDSNLNLYELLLSMTPMTEMNTARFPNLQYLSIGYSPISKIDLTKNPNLYMLYASGMKGDPITYIDVTQCPKLLHFFAMDNALTKVDFSNNPNLASVYVCQNQLTELDMSNNPDLIELICWRNNLSFATLPAREIGYYTYSPQNNFPIAESYEVGEEIDLSSQLMVLDHRTSYSWKTGDKYPYVTLQEGVDYRIDEGKTVFLKAQADPVFCEMQNEFFPSLALSTTRTDILGDVASEFSERDEYIVTAQDKHIRIRHADGYQISVYDMRGVRHASVLGTSEVEIPVAVSGLYLVRLEKDGYSSTKKVTVR